MAEDGGEPRSVLTCNLMDVREFVEAGYLQEVNRQFFHPLGLALVVDSEDGNNYRIGGVLDSRDDPEGVVFSPGTASYEKALSVARELQSRCLERGRRLGFIVQPAPAQET